MKQQRIGIFSGVFDPVHAGHLGFALAAIEKAKLDKVYLLVEAKPRRKTGVTHVAHRLAMARLAVAHHPTLSILELPDSQFSVAKTLPRLKCLFPKDRLVLLAGSDMLEHMPDWPLIRQMLEQVGLVVGRRHNIAEPVVKQLITALPTKSKDIYIITSPSPEAASRNIREAIRHNKDVASALPSLRNYITDNWLYVAPSASSSRSSS